MESIKESKERLRRLKVVRKTDIHRKNIDYLRFTRGYKGNTSYLYLNGKKINPLDLPLIVDRIYERRTLRHQFGKSSQLDEDVILPYWMTESWI